MRNIKLHILVLILVVIAELIGTKSIPVGVGNIVLLPMLYAMILGVLMTPKFLKLAKEKEMDDAGSLIGLTLMLLMARYGTNIGPTLPQILAASPALILQEFGNLGTVFFGIPIGVLIGLRREVIGGAHSIAREPNVALVGDMFGLDSEEGRGVLGVYIVGTVFGTIFMGLLVSFLAVATPLHPYSLAMATGVGSASMMTAGVGSLVAMFPDMVLVYWKPFLALATPILAYAGIYTGKNLDALKQTGWRIVVLAIFVMIGTYVGSAVIAEIILRLLGQI